MNCIDVIRELITRFKLESDEFTILEHFVEINWRVKYPTIQQKFQNLSEGLTQHQPYRIWKLRGYDILSEDFLPTNLVSDTNRVISLASVVKCQDEEIRHLAMMNLHPEVGLTLEDAIAIVADVTRNMPGYILKTGRYQHFYGMEILTEREWIRFMAQFLMSTIIVSPRYIGHSLYRGYCCLRLTAEPEYKPIIPYVICSINGLKSSQCEKDATT